MFECFSCMLCRVEDIWNHCRSGLKYNPFGPSYFSLKECHCSLSKSYHVDYILRDFLFIIRTASFIHPYSNKQTLLNTCYVIVTTFKIYKWECHDLCRAKCSRIDRGTKIITTQLMKIWATGSMKSKKGRRSNSQKS